MRILQGTAFDTYAEVMAAATQVGSNTVITFDATTSITLENITRTSLVADDFRFI
jgi:serralysin